LTLTTSNDRTESNKCESPFLRLPPEIRNQIYEYVFYEGAYRFYNPSTALPQTYPALRRFPFKFDHKVLDRFGILRVSRQLYGEVAILPFRLSTFSFDSRYSRGCLKDVLTYAQCRAIARIEVHIKDDYLIWFLEHKEGNRSEVEAGAVSFRGLGGLKRLKRLCLTVYLCFVFQKGSKCEARGFQGNGARVVVQR
jgi:hypothetical protein